LSLRNSQTMEFITLLGFAAGTLTTLSFVPQVHKAWRTRRCDDLSLTMLVVFAMGVLLWLVYGLVLHAAPIITANAVTLALILWLLHLKFRYRQKTIEEKADAAS
jgi:MtN3 and saliva related transmembrane protein